MKKEKEEPCVYSCFVSLFFLCEDGCDTLLKRLEWKYTLRYEILIEKWTC